MGEEGGREMGWPSRGTGTTHVIISVLQAHVSSFIIMYSVDTVSVA